MGIEYTVSDMVRQEEGSPHPEHTAQSHSSSEIANIDGDGHDAMVVDTADG
jgi:hypothetical protein